MLIEFVAELDLFDIFLFHADLQCFSKVRYIAIWH